GDDADLARAVAVAPALGHLAGVARFDRLDRPALANAPHDFGRRHHVIHAPAVRAADVHVLDEAHDVPGAAPAFSHGEDMRVVHAALDDHVYFDGPEAGGGRGVDAFQHLGDREVRVVHRPDGRLVQRIE